ncbi:hypothetical protein CAPTEDRAFT_221549 [Capitella teleta]|uniref:COMM domain-containing protein 3 n=1 Tax=Capitella teleta TaxID=283909 RepID=R7U800_CAPTE|nr:hypothetical protein CAPTEDRAFT_221549 [Capitella teleta]|eukprot:ELT99250.1 hypothetical protein CAPTEDRAFT_221549 [Capitella teleta]
MELSPEVSRGLQLAGDTAHIPDKLYTKLVSYACDVLLEPSQCGPVPDAGADAGCVKGALAALSTLFLEAAKHDINTDSLSHTLEDSKFSNDRIEIFSKKFLAKKHGLRALLSSIGNFPPHIVDVDWRIQHYIKNDCLNRVCQPLFLIDLKTEKSDAGEQSVQLACNQEELQDLVGKLRDACKTLQRTAQES